MIIDVTYEGDGVFKIWPPPRASDVPEIIERIKTMDAVHEQQTDLPTLRYGMYEEDDA